MDQLSQISSLDDSQDATFENTFSDSEDEIVEEECTFGNKPLAGEDDTKLEKDNHKNTLPDDDTGDEEREMQHISLQDNVQAHLFAERQDMPTIQTSTGSEKHNMSVDDSKHVGDNSDAASNTIQNIPTKKTFKENLKHGWELYEEDLWCMPLTYNKTVQSLTSKTGKSANGPKNQLKKMMKKSKKGAYRFVYMSPMTMIARIAKKNGYDLATFMETSEFIGGPHIHMPCMQCYEQFGGKLGSGFESMLDNMGQDGGSRNGKCLKCGGQIQTLASFGKMIRQMRDKIEDKGLIPHDVYPDGNCLFAAIVDQLRVQGDFSFTPHTLRQAAVNYLKENPNADDGTPLEMFLTDGETWSMYLTRMSEDGEWGDHMILRALANVISKRILIFGGTSGQSETILLPTSYNGTDNSESEIQDSNDGLTIYLGHVSESHYISLRPKCWRQELRKGFKQRIKSDESSLKKQVWTACQVNQLNFILRQAYRMDCVQTVGSDFIDVCYPSLQRSGCKMDMFGSVVCKLVPIKRPSDSLGPDLSMFFPSAKEEEDLQSCFQKPTLTAFCVPNDTNVVQNLTFAKSVDLIAENDTKVIGNLKLVPKVPNKWKGQTVTQDENSMEKTYLTGLDLNIDFLDEIMPTETLQNDARFTCRIAFKCAWPALANEWLKRRRKSGFPDEYTIKTVVNEGCHVISLTSDITLSDIIDDPINFFTSADDHIWCYTFAAAEKEICRFLSAEQRQSFLVFKSLVDVTIKDIPIPSSTVKSIFFYACENIEKQTWKSKPGECLLLLLKKLVYGLQTHHIQHYFIQEKNLLAQVPREAVEECSDRLECARRMPIVTLYFLLDQLNIMSSDIGGFVEEIIETMKADIGVDTREQITNKSLLPVCTELMKNMIYQDDFHSAWLAFQDIVDEEKFNLEVEGINLLRRLLPDMHLGYIWCFTLYIDIKQKTNLTSKVCKSYSCVHITEVLGPDCIEELPDTLVPECFSIESGDLLFLETVSSIISETISGLLYIKCMKFYLQKYSELAGDSIIIPNSTSEVSTSQFKTFSLQDIFVKLFNFCYSNRIPEEFREMMPLYTKIVEELGTQTCFRNLVFMWQSLGESKKVEDVRKKMGVGREGTALQNVVSSILSEYELD